MDNNLEPLGLENLGNTCFMNSALQCLARTKQLIPKLELFGNGNELVLSVVQTDNDAQVTVLNESPISKNNENGEENEDNRLHGEGNPAENSFRIEISIPADSMIGRLKHCFKAITRYQDANPVSETNGQRNYLSRHGGFYGFRPHDVHNMIAKHFRPGQQHDSHELIRTVVDILKKDQTKAFRVAIMKRFGVAKNGEGSDPKMVDLVKSLDQKVKHKTFIDEIFGGELMTTQTCLACHSIKRSHEEFLDLSLPIRVSKQSRDSESNGNRKTNGKKYSLFDEDDNIVINRTVQECLQAFTEPAFLTGSNVVECENCHKINLAKVEAGANFEDIFPDAKKIIEKSSGSLSSPENQSRGKNKKGGKGRENRRRKRNARQAKSKGQDQTDNKIDETAEKEEQQPGPSNSCTSISLVENHFKHPSETKNDDVREDKEKQIKMVTDQEGLDDYVIISSNSAKANEFEPQVTTQINEQCGNIEDYDDVELPPVYSVEMEQEEPLLPEKRLSESMEDIHKLSKSDDGGDEEEDDSDLPPALEGIGGSISDGEEDNGVAPLDLPDFPAHDKFEYFKLQSADEELDITNNVSETEVEKGTTADEGFSEGENSPSVENETQIPRPTGPSDSSSRTSASDLVFGCGSDSDDSSSKSSAASANDGVVIMKELPKIPITKCPCSRQQNISRPPEFLTIHLKRFQISYKGFTSKLNEHVEFPLILDLTPFCVSQEDERVIEHRKDTIFDEDGQVVYALYGIVEHSGSIHWGHYVAYIRVPPTQSNGVMVTEEGDGDAKLEDKWYYISDSHVSKSSESGVKRRDPYVLFYERIRGAEKKRRLATLQRSSSVEEVASSSFRTNSSPIINGWGDDSPAESTSKNDATSSWIGNWNDTKPETDENWDEPDTVMKDSIKEGDALPANTGTCVWETQANAVGWDRWDDQEQSSQQQKNLEKIVSEPTE